MEVLKQVRALKKEIAGLKYSIAHAKPEIAVDYYKDYRTGKGVPKSLIGFAFDKKGIMARERQLKSKLRQIEALIQAAEKEIDQIADPEMRAILRLYYIEGLDYRKIAKNLYMSKSTVERRIKNFHLKIK